jgi:hypothetical protein
MLKNPEEKQLGLKILLPRIFDDTPTSHLCPEVRKICEIGSYLGQYYYRSYSIWMQYFFTSFPPKIELYVQVKQFCKDKS